MHTTAPVTVAAEHPQGTFEGTPTCRRCVEFNGSQLAKMKRIFLTCPCHKIYGEEAVALKSLDYTLNIVNMWYLGLFHENLIFCQ